MVSAFQSCITHHTRQMQGAIYDNKTKSFLFKLFDRVYDIPKRNKFILSDLGKIS